LALSKASLGIGRIFSSADGVGWPDMCCHEASSSNGQVRQLIEQHLQR
jgi:hypothetical protein